VALFVGLGIVAMVYQDLRCIEGNNQRRERSFTWMVPGAIRIDRCNFETLLKRN